MTRRSHELIAGALIAASMFFSAMTVPSARATDSSACYAIADADQRALCIAKARREPSACYSITNSSLRSQCLAEVRK